MLTWEGTGQGIGENRGNVLVDEALTRRGRMERDALLL
jgi:hypothetical protein